MSEPDSTFNIYEDTPTATRTCPKCGQGVRCFRPTASVFFSCPNCQAYFRAAPGELPTLAHEPLPPTTEARLWLALGSEGTLSGYRLRVTGYQLRGEQEDAIARWGEYQLAPADEAAAAAAAQDSAFPIQLAEYQGHWLLVRPADVSPGRVPLAGEIAPDVTDGNRPYRLWHRYQPRILAVRGEFDWDVFEDEKLTIEELTGPPYQLVGEHETGGSYTWYRARYMEPERIAAAFGLHPKQLPSREGIGAAQPPPGTISWARLLQLAWVSGVLLLGIQALLLLRVTSGLIAQDFELADPGYALALVQQLEYQLAYTQDSLKASLPAPPGEPFTNGAMPTEQLKGQAYVDRLTQQLAAARSQPAAPTTFVSRSFQLAGPRALTLQLNMPDLDNNWVEVSLSLINEQTGQSYEATRALEYYHGVDGGESWSEGSHKETIDFDAVPAGLYHVNLYPTTDPAKPAYGKLSLQVTVNAALWSNFLLVLLVLAAPVAVLGIRRYSFEQARWKNSDFGPVSSE